MSTVAATEELIEDVGVGLLRSLGVPSRRGQQVDEAGERAGVTACLLRGRFAAAAHRHNSHLPAATANAVAASLSRPPYPSLIENNRWSHGLLIDGVPVEYKDPQTAEMRGGQGLMQRIPGAGVGPEAEEPRARDGAEAAQRTDQDQRADNLVQAQKCREALEKAMLGYTNKQISTAETIAKSLELADRHPSESAPIYAWEPSDPATEPTLVFL